MNSIGQLKEYHDRSRTGDPPTYTFEQDVTTKIYTAICSYRNKKTHGLGISKKDSQRAAADKMLLQLNVTPRAPIIESVRRTSPVEANNASSSTAIRKVGKVLTENEKLKALRFLAEYGDKDPKSDARKSMAPDHYIIDDVDMGLKSKDAPNSITLTSESRNADAIDTFKQVMKEMKLKFCCKVPEIKHDVQLEHIVLVQINHKIHLMAGGTGVSVELATYAACEKAMTMLKIYTA